MLRNRRDVLEEPALVRVRLGEVEREPDVGVPESAVNVAVPHGCVPPFVDVDVRLGERLVGRIARPGTPREGCGLLGHRCSFHADYLTPLRGRTAKAAIRTRTNAAAQTPK